MNIAQVKAYQVLDSRGEPTIRVRMDSDTGNHARFDAPSGKSVSTQEAKERRDNEAAWFAGKGVTGNVDIIEKIIAPKFIGYPLGHQADFDALITALDGTDDKSNLGTNTLTAMSGAYFLLSCYEQGKEVWQAVADTLGTTPAAPRLYANLVGGGAHAPGLDIQEFMIVPKTTQPSDAINLIYSVHKTLRSIFSSLYGPSTRLTSDEGAMVALGATPEVVLEAFQQLAGTNGSMYDIALDCAANHFYANNTYTISNQALSTQQLAEVYQQWDKKFPMLSIEDPFSETDLEGLRLLAAQPGRKMMLVGDDTTATNAARIEELAAQHLINAVIIKPNQVGTITDMFTAITTSLKSGLKLIMSHRAGETNDTILADIAYGIGAFGLKLGAPVRGERVAKYNRLFELEKDLGLKSAPVIVAAAKPAMAPVTQTQQPMPTGMNQKQGPQQAPGPIHLDPVPGPLSGLIPTPAPASQSAPAAFPLPATDLHVPPGGIADEAARALHRYEPASGGIAAAVTADTMGQPMHSPHATAISPANSMISKPTFAIPQSHTAAAVTPAGPVQAPDFPY